MRLCCKYRTTADISYLMQPNRVLQCRYVMTSKEKSKQTRNKVLIYIKSSPCIRPMTGVLKETKHCSIHLKTLKQLNNVYPRIQASSLACKVQLCALEVLHYLQNVYPGFWPLPWLVKCSYAPLHYLQNVMCFCPRSNWKRWPIPKPTINIQCLYKRMGFVSTK